MSLHSDVPVQPVTVSRNGRLTGEYDVDVLIVPTHNDVPVQPTIVLPASPSAIHDKCHHFPCYWCYCIHRTLPQYLEDTTATIQPHRQSSASLPPSVSPNSSLIIVRPDPVPRGQAFGAVDQIRVGRSDDGRYFIRVTDDVVRVRVVQVNDIYIRHRGEVGI